MKNLLFNIAFAILLLLALAMLPGCASQRTISVTFPSNAVARVQETASTPYIPGEWSTRIAAVYSDGQTSLTVEDHKEKQTIGSLGGGLIGAVGGWIAASGGL